MSKILFLFAICIAFGNCFGQDIEFLGLEYALYPSSKVSSVDSLASGFTELEMALLIPTVIKKRFNLLLGGVYRLVIPEGDNRTSNVNLFFLGANIIAAYNFSERKQLILTAIPATSTTTDSRGLATDNFLMQGGLLYRKTVSSVFTYTLGLLSTSRFGSPIVVPALGILYKTEKIKLTVNLPFLIQSTWNYQGNLAYSLKIAVNGSQYNFENEFYNEDQLDVVNFSRIRIGPELQYRIKGPLLVSLYGGIAANRTYDFELMNGDDIDLSLVNGPFIAARIFLKPLHKNN